MICTVKLDKDLSFHALSVYAVLIFSSICMVINSVMSLIRRKCPNPQSAYHPLIHHCVKAFICAVFFMLQSRMLPRDAQYQEKKIAAD